VAAVAASLHREDQALFLKDLLAQEHLSKLKLILLPTHLVYFKVKITKVPLLRSHKVKEEAAKNQAQLKVKIG